MPPHEMRPVDVWMLGLLEMEEQPPLTREQRADVIVICQTEGDPHARLHEVLGAERLERARSRAEQLGGEWSKEAIAFLTAKPPSTEEVARLPKPRDATAVDAWPRRSSADIGDGTSPGALARWRESVRQIVEAAAAACEAADDDVNVESAAFLEVDGDRVPYPVARLSAHLHMVETAAFSLACALRACKAEEACAPVMRVLGEIGPVSDTFARMLIAGRHMGPSTGAAVGAAAEELRLLSSMALKALDARSAQPSPPLLCAADAVCKMFGHALALLWGVKMDARSCSKIVTQNQRRLTRENRSACLNALGSVVVRVDAFYMHVARSFREGLGFFERAGFVKMTAAGVSVRQRVQGHLATLHKHNVHYSLTGRSDRVIDALDAGDDRCENIIQTLFDAMKRSESHIPSGLAPTVCVPVSVLNQVIAELDAVLGEITPAFIEEQRGRCHRAVFNRAKAMHRATVQLRDECRSNAARYRKTMAAHRAATMQQDKGAREAERVRDQVRSHHQSATRLRAQWIECGRKNKALRDEITSRLGKARVSAAGSACPETQRLWEAFRSDVAEWRADDTAWQKAARRAASAAKA